MNKIFKITTAGPLACDIVFENQSKSATQGRLVNGTFVFNDVLTTENRRVTLRKIPNSCRFEAVSFSNMNPNPSLTDIENISTPLFTANALAPSLPIPKNTSSMMGCQMPNLCTDTNNLTFMRDYYTAQTLNTMSTIFRTASNGPSTCQMEFSWGYSNRNYNRMESGTDVWNFNFTRDPIRCVYKLKGGDQDVTWRTFKSRHFLSTNKVPMNPIQAGPLAYSIKACAGDIDCTNKQVQDAAIDYYAWRNWQGYRDAINIVSTAKVASNICEYAVRRIFPNGSTSIYADTKQYDQGNQYTMYHHQFHYLPDVDCGGYTPYFQDFNIRIGDSYTDGNNRPENPSCYPIDCENATLKSVVTKYINTYRYTGSFAAGTLKEVYKGYPADIEKSLRVDSNRCEYQITSNVGTTKYRQGTSAYDPKYHVFIDVKSMGGACDPAVKNMSYIQEQSQSQIFTPFSCPTFTG
ncbi:hypothetical protein EBU71_19540, partial [bacterium]|nr:hypothetical protein [Candidatus Elulimicrobium humile]